MKFVYQTMIRENPKQFQVQLLYMIFNENKISTIKFWNKYLFFEVYLLLKNSFLPVVRKLQLIDTRLRFTQHQEM